MSKPDPPTPPNPIATAAAQTGTNVATGVANSMLNNVNQITPQGNLSYDVTSNYSWTDPSNGQTYSIPRFTATQTQTDAQKNIQAQRDATQLNLATAGNQQSARAGQILNTTFAPGSGAPAAGEASTLATQYSAIRNYDAGGNIQKSLGDSGAITKDYGPADNFSADRSRVEDSLYGRLNPQLQKDRSAIEQRLADQGIRYGSQAYTSAMDDYNRQSNDARLAVTAQGGQEQQRMMDMAAQRAGFQNAAQQQQYTQNLGAGSFANAAQQQQNAQNASAAGFYNAGAAQNLNQTQSIFNAQNAQRNQYMQEQYAQRNQPLNEISGLMSGSQVSSPNFVNTPGSQIATTDIGGLINQNFAQQSQNYQTANQNWQSTMGGLLGLGGKLGGAAIMASDERIKENVTPIGTVFAAGEDGEAKKLPISEWSYKGDPARHVGPMAQDVEKIDKSAVTTRGGVKHIYPHRVMGSILRAA
jgi:hypothetical protein